MPTSHKLNAQEVARLLKKKTRAPPEAVKLKLPNPSQRSPKVHFLPLFKGESEGPTKPPNTPASTPFHSNGPFLDSFKSHLQTHSGGNRSSTTALQLTRSVGKFLYAVNPTEVKENRLLQVDAIDPYLHSLCQDGMGAHFGSQGRSQLYSTHRQLLLTVRCT